MFWTIFFEEFSSLNPSQLFLTGSVCVYVLSLCSCVCVVFLSCVCESLVYMCVYLTFINHNEEGLKPLQSRNLLNFFLSKTTSNLRRTLIYCFIFRNKQRPIEGAQMYLIPYFIRTFIFTIFKPEYAVLISILFSVTRSV